MPNEIRDMDLEKSCTDSNLIKFQIHSYIIMVIPTTVVGVDLM